MFELAQVTSAAEKERKLPLFVAAYETMYNRIKDGTYKPGDKLPSESELSVELAISRGTLRQAMLLLQEDGLIMNYKGKGSFVLETSRELSTGIEKIFNPLTTCSIQPIDRVVTEMHFQPATELHRKLFDLPQSSLVSRAEFSYFIKDKVVGFALVFMPYDLLVENGVAIDDNDEIHRFYNSFLSTERLSCESVLRLGFARKLTADKMHIKEKEPILIMEETFYMVNRPLMQQKIFFQPAYYELKILRSNDRYTSKQGTQGQLPADKL